MNALLATLLILPALTAAEAATLRGKDARALMESAAAAGFPVENLDSEWNEATVLRLSTGPLVCHYTAVPYPDDWLSDVRCFRGSSPEGDALPNSLALAQRIRPYALEDAGLGNRWLAVEDVRCSLRYGKKHYRCDVKARVWPGEPSR